MHPTQRAIRLCIAGLGVALLPTLLAPSLWTFWPVYLGVLLLGLGADALLRPVPEGVRCNIDFPRTLFIGESATARLEVALPSRRPIPFEVRVDLSEELEPQPILRATAGERGRVLELPLVPLRRGRIRAERAWIRYGGPVGLVASVVKVDLDRVGVVTPNIGAVKDLALRLSSRRDFRAGLKVERYRGDGSEFDTLKEFTRGDDHRHIDWKSTARCRSLVVRQHRAERNHQVILAVDTGRLMCESLEGIPKLDHAVNAALLLAWVSLRCGDQVGLYGFDGRVGLYQRPRSGMNHHKRLVQHAARLEYSEAETNFTLGLTTLLGRLERRSLVVLLTDFVDSVTAELMIGNLGRLARRHVVVFVTLRDPVLVEIAHQRPDDGEALQRAVVADRLLRDREVVLTRLRRLGVLTVDAAPRHVSGRLINSYLDVLRRERIG